LYNILTSFINKLLKKKTESNLAFSFRGKKTIQILKRKIITRKKNAINPVKRLAKNIQVNSFANRFLLYRKSRRLYKKTSKYSPLITTTKEEEDIFYRTLNFKKYQKILFYQKNVFFSRRKPLAKMRYRPAKLYISNLKKNTFTTIQEVVGDDYDKHIKVYYKSSCGAIGYKGPKKSTKFARDDVIKRTGNFFNDSFFTSVDINLKGKITRWNRRYLRNMFDNMLYFRTINILSNRPHGSTRLQKQKRK
jgi:hypothetical protein